MMLTGPRLTLRPFGPEQITDRYLAWLSDPVVNQYSQRAGQPPQSRADAETWLASLASTETVLAIHDPDQRHVGNIKFGPIDTANSRSDISILLGERDCWGRGYGAEAVTLVTRHLFDTVGLNRVDAGSANPAFIAMVRKLGWTIEGRLRERVRIGGALVDWTLMGMLKREYRLSHSAANVISES